MNRQKKFVLSVLSAAVLVSAGYVGYREVTNDESSDLLLANVEALTRNEEAIERGPSKYNDCEVCGVTVKFCECENRIPCAANLCKCY